MQQKQVTFLNFELTWNVHAKFLHVLNFRVLGHFEIVFILLLLFLKGYTSNHVLYDTKASK